MMEHHSIFIVSGTNRPVSNTLRIARVVEAHYAGAGVKTELFSLADLPPEIFSPEAYGRKPPDFERLQDRVIAAAGLHLIIPEYNGSFPGVLKHFIDMLKFPESFDRKPAAFVGVANGQWGGLRAVEQMQMVVGYRNAHVYPGRIFVPHVQNKLDAQGQLIDADLDARFAKQTRGFAAFAGLFVPKH
ncbi:MAG TPA: NAD(P)H-dependent oxidoreductase [Tepidisphaeraceae bacterium]|jgi:NAD(P)H-dependent FMN reductase|nr:NAD(P)H-dependent oxidoreductase [Tepidisphaeraceae bacterium]